LAAAKANRLWKEAAKDSSFVEQIERLQVAYELDFGMAALSLFLKLQGQFVTFMIRRDSYEAELIAVMAEMGFFALTGQRYQMVVPQRLTVMKVKRALVRLARTEDAEFVLHPEHLVTTVPFVEAKAWQKRLRDMDEERRTADRELLLEDCGRSVRSAPSSSGSRRRPPGAPHVATRKPKP
jgi:hypothetical protein